MSFMTNVGARTAAIGVGAEAAAAAEVFANEQRQPRLPQCRLAARSDVPADAAAVVDGFAVGAVTEDDRSHRQHRPCRSTGPFIRAARAWQQRPPPAESGGYPFSGYVEPSTRLSVRHSHGDSATSVCGTDRSVAPDTLLMRCGDEGRVAPESVRVHCEADGTTGAVAGDCAKLSSGNTAHPSRMPDFVDLDAIDDAVAAMASVTVATGAAAQLEGDGAAAQSNSSSLPTLSKELQRTLPPSAVITADDHDGRRRQQAMMRMPPSQSFEKVCTETVDTAQQRCPSPAARRTYCNLSDGCSSLLCEAGGSRALPATATPGRPHADIPSFAPLPAGACARGKGGGGRLADTGMGCTRGGGTLPFVAADSSSSLSPPPAESSSPSPLTASLMQHIHGNPSAPMATAPHLRAYPFPRAPGTTTSAATMTAHPAPTALSPREGRTPRRLATRPAEGSDFFELKLPATAPAETAALQGCSPRTPRSHRASHLLAQVRVALIDAQSVRGHLGELRALLPKHCTSSVAATLVPDANAGARSDEAGEVDGVLEGSDGSAGIVGCTTATGPSKLSLHRALREGKADDIGSGGRLRASGESCSGASSTPHARASPGRVSSRVQPSPGLHRNNGVIDGDGDGEQWLAATFNVRGLYTSSLNGYRYQRLTRLTEQHLKSLWLAISAVAKSVCGATVEQCVQMDLAQGPARGDAEVLPSLLRAALQPLASPPVTSLPASRDPWAPGGAAVSAQGVQVTELRRAPSCTLKRSSAAGPPNPGHSCRSSEDPRAAPLTEGKAVEAAAQRLPNTKRGDQPSTRHFDSQCRSLDEAAPLDSVSAGGGAGAPASLSAHPIFLTTAANSSAVTCTLREEGASANSGSSTVASTSQTTATRVPVNTSTAAAPCIYSDRYHSSSSNYSSRHHSATSPMTSPKWSNTSTTGTVYVHSARRSPSCAAAVSSELNDVRSSSRNRMHDSSCGGSSARDGGGGNVAGAAGSAFSGLSRPVTPTEVPKAPTSGGGQPSYTLPSTLLLQLSPQQPRGLSSPSAPPASIGGATPSIGPESLPIAPLTHLHLPLHPPLSCGCNASASAPLTALPHHTCSRSWNSEGNGALTTPTSGSANCPLAGWTPGPTWVLPPPSPAPPPPSAADESGAAQAAGSAASKCSVGAPAVPSVWPGRCGAAGVRAGAATPAEKGPCTHFSGAAPTTPSASPPGLGSVHSLPAAVPTRPVQASLLKVGRGKVTADVTPDGDADERVSGAGLAAAAATAVPAAGLAPFTTNGSSEEVKGEAAPLLLCPASTPWTREHMDMRTATNTALAASTRASSSVTEKELPVGGSAGGSSRSSGDTSSGLLSSSASRRQRQLQHALSLLLPADGHRCDVRLHSDQPRARASTEAERGKARRAAFPTGTAQALPTSQQRHARGEGEPNKRWGAQALPFLRSSLLLLETTPAPSVAASPAASAVSAEGQQEVDDDGEGDDANAAAQVSGRLLAQAHAVAEGPTAGRMPYGDGGGGAGAVERNDEAGVCLGSPMARRSSGSLPSPRPQGPGDHDVTSVDAPPHAPSAASSSLSYTTISASTAEATSAVVTAMAVAGARVPLSAPAVAPPALLRAEPCPWQRGDGRVFTHSVLTSDLRLDADMCDEGASWAVKRSRSGSSDSGGNGAAGRASHTPQRGAMPRDQAQHRPLHAAPSPVRWDLSLTSTSATASLAMHSPESTDALPTRAEDQERERNTISAASLPGHRRSPVMGTHEALPCSSSPTVTESAQVNKARGVPATEAEWCEADASVTQVGGGASVADASSSLASFLSPLSCSTRGGRHVGTVIDLPAGTAAALHQNQSAASTALVQPPDISHAVARTHRPASEDRGESIEAENLDDAVDEAAVGEGEDGRDLLPVDANSDARDWTSSPRCVPVHQHAWQRQQCHPHPLMQTWSGVLTFSTPRHSAATMSSIRTTIASMTLSASVAALGSQRSGSSARTSDTSTALASVAEALLGIGTVGGAGSGASGGGPGAHAGAAVASLGTKAIAPAAVESTAAAAAAFTVTMVTSATAAAGSSSWTPNSTITLSSTSASVAGSTSPSTALGTTASSAASDSLSSERYSSAGGGVAAEAAHVPPAGREEGGASVGWRSAKAPLLPPTAAPAAISAAGGGSNGAACDADFDGFALDAATFDSAPDFAASRPRVRSERKPLPLLPPPQNYSCLLPEVPSPRLRDGGGVCEEDEDDADTAGDARYTVSSALPGADFDSERDECHCAASPVRGGSDVPSSVEIPRCGEAKDTGCAYSDRSVEDRGAITTPTDSPPPHHNGGKVNVGVRLMRSPLGSSPRGELALTAVAASAAVTAAGVPGQQGTANGYSGDGSSRSGRGTANSHAAGEAAPRLQSGETIQLSVDASRTAATDACGAGGASSPYAAVLLRAAVTQAPGADTHERDEDTCTSELRTAPADVSTRACSPPASRPSAFVSSSPTATTATAMPGSGASANEGNEAVRAISCTHSGGSVSSALSSPPLCTTNTSAASRSLPVVSYSPLQQRGATGSTASGAARMTAAAAAATQPTAGVGAAVAAVTTASMASERAQAGRRVSPLHHPFIEVSALGQGNVTASSNHNSNRDGSGCHLSQCETTLPAAVPEGRAPNHFSGEAALGQPLWSEGIHVEPPDTGVAGGPALLPPSEAPQEQRPPIRGNARHEDVVAGLTTSLLDLRLQPGSTSAGCCPSSGGGPTRGCECRVRQVFTERKGSVGDASGGGAADAGVGGGDAIHQAAPGEEEEGARAQMTTTAARIASWPPAMPRPSERQTSRPAPIATWLVPVRVKDSRGAETLQGGDLGADPVVSDAARTASVASFADGGARDKTNRVGADDAVNTFVGEGESRAASERCSRCSGTGKGVSVAAAPTSPAQASSDSMPYGAKDTAAAMVALAREPADKEPAGETTASRLAAAAPTASLRTSPPSPSLCIAEVPSALLGCSREGPSRCLSPASPSSAPVGCINGDGVAVPRSAETEKKSRNGSHAVDAGAVIRDAAPDSEGALLIAPRPLARTPSPSARGTLGSDTVVTQLPSQAAGRTAPERAPSTNVCKSRERPTRPVPPTLLLIPTYYLAQCEDGLADVAGNTRGWHAATSAFFSEAVATAAAPGRTHSTWGGPTRRASDLYAPVSMLARHRAQERARYRVARPGVAAAPPYMPATTAYTPLSASATPVLPSHADVTADDSEGAAATPTSPPGTLASFTHNDRLLALMKRALRLAGGDGGTC
ncbi:hypothetical protein LSCM1_08265 [Leishmania martiniquensis]|uniref:Uncharacterized protein n=1 Tax=Leishmania martiniquensis TaxID=1580590 RepID=A0A836HPG3_9TRYP|nr:hypothetical protein LSCM1_08265 [Leishmania martiniquensis]